MSVAGTVIPQQQYVALYTSLGVDAKKFAKLFSGVVHMLRAAVRGRISPATVRTDLGALKLPDQFVADFANVLRKARDVLEDNASKNIIRAPHVVDMKWRVDVTISTSSLSRALRPGVTMQLFLSDGSIKTFEMSVDKFHALRYNVAKVLREMGDLEAHPMMFIMEQLERNERKELKSQR